MATREEQLQQAHDDGEKDGSKNEFNPPHDSLVGGLDLSKKQTQENDAYRQGYRNAQKQKK